MAFKKGENPNHPKKGASIKVDPIQELVAIAQIKEMLVEREKWRDHCIFTLGINTAWRANELLSLTVGHVRDLTEGDGISLKQSKTKKYRITPINSAAFASIRCWLDVYGNSMGENAPLFPSAKYGAITVPTLCNMVKKWCEWVSARGHFGSHSLRKTWGYHQRATFGTPLPLIMRAYGHSSERQTLDYLCIQPSEVIEIFRHEL